MKWEVLESSYSLVTPWLKIRKDSVKMTSGIIIPDFYVEELPDWVNVIAVTKEGEFLIEEQYRHGIGNVCYELCAGIVEEGEIPLESAKRELLEETGYISREWMAFGRYAPNASGSNNYCYTFVARDIEKVTEQKLDKTEEIKLHIFKKEQIQKMMLNGSITEAVMLAPLWRYFANK